jgi:organic radical activating enzyme
MIDVEETYLVNITMKLKCNTCDGIFNTVDIRFTKKCDNNCSFCIERFSGIPGKETNVAAIFKEVLKSGADEVLILGGEPFLEIDKLLRLVNMLWTMRIRIYITTSLPITIRNNYETFHLIMKKITGLNVSLHHYNNRVNNSVFCNDSHNRIMLLDNIVFDHGDKVRVCVNLVKGFIDNGGKLKYMLAVLDSMGVSKVKINELCHSDSYVSFEKITGIKLGSPYSTGCYTSVFKQEYPDMEIQLKRSCFINEPSLSASLMDLLKVFLNRWIVKPLHNSFCVIYEDGTRQENWIIKKEE